jgi:YD repeat-containing protein
LKFHRKYTKQGDFLTSNGATITSGRTYRADGLLTGQNYGNGLNETRAYDLQGRLTAWALAGTDNRAYTYDPNSNILNITGLPAATYGYDSLDRLTSETSNAFTYDPNGNRLSDAAGTYSYTTASNKMTGAPQGAVVVNAAGLTTSDQSERMLSVAVGINLVGTSKIY